MIKKSNVFLEDHHENFICLISYSSENILTLYKPISENSDRTTIRTSPESHIYWNDHFHKNQLYFQIFADFEACNGIDHSSIGNKTNNF